MKTFSIIGQVSVDRFLQFFHVFEIINLTMKKAQRIGGHHACLGDIAQNIAKMFFLLIFLGVS